MRTLLEPEAPARAAQDRDAVHPAATAARAADTLHSYDVEGVEGRAPSAWRDRVILETLAGIIRHRVFASILVFLCGGVAALATSRVEPWYVATATIFPAAQSNPMGALGFAGIANLVGNLGGGMGGSSQFPIYENVVQSERLIADLLDTRLPETRGTLLDHLEIPEPDPTRRMVAATAVVREAVRYDTDKKTGLVLISYRDRDPEVAAAVANRILELLNDFDISTSAELAAERRRFVDARLAEARDSLELAERQLEGFAAENLRIGRAPDLLLAQARLERELNIRQEVYLALRKEAEMARIEEQRTVPAISVLDHASVPVLPAGPSLVRNVALGIVLGVLGTFALFAFLALSPLQFLRGLRSLGTAR
jgi:uncharacterized protein involved in exopolysaccharide biosynthesis